jgi:hypothetical protein
VAGNLAGFPDAGPLLNLHKRTDLGAIPDLAAIEIGEITDNHILAQLDIRRDTAERGALRSRSGILD